MTDAEKLQKIKEFVIERGDIALVEMNGCHKNEELKFEYWSGEFNSTTEILYFIWSLNGQ